MDIEKSFVSIFEKLQLAGVLRVVGVSLLLCTQNISSAYSASLDAERIISFAERSIKLQKLRIFNENAHVNFSFRENAPSKKTMAYINFLSAFIPQMSNTRKSGDFSKSNIVIIIDKNAVRKMLNGQYGFNVKNRVSSDTYCFVSYETAESDDFIKNGLIVVDSTEGERRLNGCVYTGVMSFFGAMFLNKKDDYEMVNENLKGKLDFISDVIVARVVTKCKHAVILDKDVDVNACVRENVEIFVK